MLNKIFILIMALVLMIGITQADMEISSGDDDAERVIDMVTPDPPTNYSQVDTNSSDYWDNLDDPDDISGSEFWYNQSLFDNWVDIDGDTMTGDLSMGLKKITNVEAITLWGSTQAPLTILNDAQTFAYSITGDTSVRTHSQQLPAITGKFAMLEGTQTFTGAKTFQEVTTFENNITMDENFINRVKTIFFADSENSTFGDDPDFAGFWGAGNSYGKFWMPTRDYPAFYISPFNASQQVDVVFGTDALTGYEMDYLFYEDGTTNHYMVIDVYSPKQTYFSSVGIANEKANFVFENWRPSNVVGFTPAISLTLQSREIDTRKNVTLTYNPATDDLTIDKEVNIAENLNISGNFTGNQIYGEMYYHNDTATSLNFAVDGTYYNIFMTDADYLNGFTFNGGFGLTSNLTAQVDGVYKASFFAVGDGQNNHEYHSAVFVNAVEQDNCEAKKKMSAGGDITTMNGDCFIRLNVGDVVDLRIADMGSTGTGNYYDGNLNLVRIGN